MRISDWSSDVCSSDLRHPVPWPHTPRQKNRRETVHTVQKGAVAKPFFSVLECKRPFLHARSRAKHRIDIGLHCSVHLRHHDASPRCSIPILTKNGPADRKSKRLKSSH